MRRLALVSIVTTAMLLTTALVGAVSIDWTPIAKKANESIVFVESKDGSCTGFVINDNVKGDKDYILTAAHCNGTDMFADGAAAKVIWKDSKHDLLILEVADTGRPALHFATKNPSIGEELASYGFGWGLARPMFRTAHVSDDNARLPEVDNGPFIMIDAAFVPGQSGGPCINAAGEVVMIVQMAGNGVGVGVGAELMRDRTGRYVGKP